MKNNNTKKPYREAKVTILMNWSDLNGKKNIVTLVSTEGEEIDFFKFALVEYENDIFTILQPIELLEGMDEDEALVFRITGTKGNLKYDIVVDDGIIDRVFEDFTDYLDRNGL